jgi:hypothetical protein
MSESARRHDLSDAAWKLLEPHLLQNPFMFVMGTIAPDQMRMWLLFSIHEP